MSFHPIHARREIPMTPRAKAHLARPLLAMAVLLTAGTTGCTRTKAMPRENAPMLRPSVTTLTPGDLVEVKFDLETQFNEIQRIRPDGKISMQLVGEIHAAGMEPAQLTDVLTEAYSAELEDPRLVVIVREQYSQRVFVGGEVNQPGVLPLQGPLTVFDALAMSGGMNMASAAPGHVFVVRQGPEGRAGYTVDMSAAISGAMTEPFYLQPGDHIYVPRTGIVNANQFMQQYIAGMVPKAGVFYSRTTGSGTFGIDTSTD